MKAKYLLLGLFTATLLGGCFRDDTSNCPGPGFTKYLYVKSYMTKYTCEELMDRVSFYVYDEQGGFVLEREYSKEELKTTGYLAEITGLEAGKYTVIGLMNRSEKDYELAAASLDAFRVSLKAGSDYRVAGKQAELFQGHHTFTFDPLTDSREQYETVRLWKNTNHFYIQVEPDGYALPEGHRITTHIRGNNGTTDRYNACTASCYRIYTPHKTLPAIRAATRDIDVITTMKIWTGSDLELVVREEDPQGAVVQERIVSIPELLAAPKASGSGRVYDTDEKLWQEDEYFLSFRIDGKFALIELTHDDWNSVKDPEIIV